MPQPAWESRAVAVAGDLAPLAPPNPLGARMLRALDGLERSQWWSPARLLQQQMRLLGPLMRHAWENVPFYRTRLAAAGLHPGKPVTPAEWSAIPPLTRADIQLAGTALRARRMSRKHGKVGTVTTSGSTGTPITVLGSETTKFIGDVITVRNHLWHRRNLAGTLAAIRNVKPGTADWPEGRRRSGWGASTAPIYRSGPAALLSVTTPIARQAEWLARQAPTCLITFPSNAEALARHCEEAGVEIPTLREVMTFGETVTPRAGKRCLAAWGAPIHDAYSTEELNYIALQCPQGTHYHVQSENVLVEVVDDDGRPCPPGGVGRVLVTALHNYATPLIRYDVGDYAEVGGPCECGRGLPVLRRIMGRVRNMLTLPGGERFWPSLGDTGYTDVAPVSQFQFVQKTPEDIEVRLVARRPPTAAEEAALRALIHARLGHPFNLIFTYHAAIERGPGGKYEDFKSEIAQ